jgi:hypothetical protein
MRESREKNTVDAFRSRRDRNGKPQSACAVAASEMGVLQNKCPESVEAR